MNRMCLYVHSTLKRKAYFFNALTSIINIHINSYHLFFSLFLLFWMNCSYWWSCYISYCSVLNICMRTVNMVWECGGGKEIVCVCVCLRFDPCSSDVCQFMIRIWWTKKIWHYTQTFAPTLIRTSNRKFGSFPGNRSTKHRKKNINIYKRTQYPNCARIEAESNENGVRERVEKIKTSQKTHHRTEQEKTTNIKQSASTPNRNDSRLTVVAFVYLFAQRLN